ncbi:hypothetical protein SCP_0405950 [Sparassis crispa]|uniref:Integrase catalytic domain-containing protein n=1 Tax=Sparassis crispa TaxID=139825 RepID=A0A401GJ63_9APHY|nr:hypothetical protein SCP_0405950 [Sparassis crispa]GBE82212.1 hypothetical protein SCP_0405950 [Sparassis crispa]
MVQYNLTIVYIRSEDNTVADALSRLPPSSFPDENDTPNETFNTWLTPSVNAVLTIATDSAVVKDITDRYLTDDFCKKVIANAPSTLGVHCSNGLWYIGDRLLIPCIKDLCENLFRMAHDCSGHFGADKSYALLRDLYYWPNMRHDLEQSYVPSCPDCQRNKSRTKKPSGPLHPLPVPDQHGDNIAMDFIGPLPADEGFNCILSITDRLHSDVHIIPTHMTLTASQLVLLFFDHWYCENGLPLDIVSNRNKLFMSEFWAALHKRIGILLKMSTAYHSQTDSVSEHMNKTINQAICYHVRHNQKGWVCALPRVRFDIMNSVNTSTGFSNFQLRLSRSPRLIPPLVPDHLELPSNHADFDTLQLISQLQSDVDEAKDNMLQAKIHQTHFANLSCGPEIKYHVGEKVMLLTLHRRREYKHKGEKCTAKFFPHFDGPYVITNAHPETSNYTLDMPNNPNKFATFHASELKPHIANDDWLFPHQLTMSQLWLAIPRTLGWLRTQARPVATRC